MIQELFLFVKAVNQQRCRTTIDKNEKQWDEVNLPGS